MNNGFNELGNELVKRYVCENPDTFLQFVECNQYTLLIILICILCFFLGIALINNGNK